MAIEKDLVDQLLAGRDPRPIAFSDSPAASDPTTPSSLPQ